MVNMVEHACGFTIVTPTHGRERLVAELLASVERARANIDVPVQMLIVDSSDQSAATAIAASCDRFHATYVRGDTNVRRKRNAGIELAQHAVILFVDSDCMLRPNCLLEHWHPYVRDVAIGGVAGITEFVGPINWFWRIVERSSFLDAFSYARRLETVPWAPTCNVSYRRDVLREIGGFDESFPFRLGGDDADLGLRVTDNGYRIVGNGGAVVEHTRETWRTPALVGKRVFRWGRMHAHLLRKYPKRIVPDFPKSSVLFALLLIVCAPLGFIDVRMIILPFIWLMVALVAEALLTPLLMGLPWRRLPDETGARMLSLLYEFGTLCESIRRRYLAPLYQEISFTPPSLHGRTRRVIQIWGAMIAWIVVMLIIIVVEG